MPRWLKFVALFMPTFAVFEVCSPEICEAQLLAFTQNSIQFSQQSAGGDSSCAFEEDCFNCAHFAHGVGFVLQPIAVLAFAHQDVSVRSVEQPPLMSYHPPRV